LFVCKETKFTLFVEKDTLTDRIATSTEKDRIDGLDKPT